MVSLIKLPQDVCLGETLVLLTLWGYLGLKAKQEKQKMKIEVDVGEIQLGHLEEWLEYVLTVGLVVVAKGRYY